MPNKYDFLYKIPSDATETDFHHRDNIVNATANIIKKFRNHDEVVTIAEMQSGKTDVMKRLIHVINKYNNEIKNININIDRHNIYLVICASSISLKNQLKLKLPEIKHKIYHLNDINIFLKKLYEYESLLTTMSDYGLIIFDECHCDAEHKKLIDKFRKILDKIKKENKTVYYKVGFSATPYEQVIENFPKVIMKPSENYYGIKEMFDSCDSTNIEQKIPILFQAKNLVDPIECESLFTEIEICNFYYIFRLPGKKLLEETAILNLEKQFKIKKSKIDSLIYDMNYGGNINELLNVKPTKPTIIYLKDKLRMGEYLNTKYVYLVHDDPNNMYAHTTAQSLLGRCCGYNKQSHQTIIYCDYEKAWQHYRWIIHDYDVDHVPSDAKYIKKSTGETKDICIYKFKNID